MKKLRVAVIGVGYLGRFHAQKYSTMSNVDLLGVVDVDMSRAEEVAAEVGTSAYASVESLMEALDAVSIAVPTSVHAEVAIPLLKAGVAVLLEKPIAGTTGEAADNEKVCSLECYDGFMTMVRSRLVRELA